jgi:hypothetical protein
MASGVSGGSMPDQRSEASISEGPRVSRASFNVGAHILVLSGVSHRWKVSVDDVELERWFATKVEAWEAGVREADRLDRMDQGPAAGAPGEPGRQRGSGADNASPGSQPAGRMREGGAGGLVPAGLDRHSNVAA